MIRTPSSPLILGAVVTADARRTFGVGELTTVRYSPAAFGSRNLDMRRKLPDSKGQRVMLFWSANQS
ncbi:hypothetical protein XBFFL1_1040020 [Xenorhabdus bovienii str. feltiae Florida]|nr:hypothetical protein XBFFR1_970030 [Xenorhabdus bovienii str. feltiae France]CDG90688.1 hypothetical protein XBFFL1_1040020 [Xenorhabdus bovienii str. feltiae Florida]